MKHNPHKRAEYFLRIVLACCLLVTGCVFCWSGLIELSPRHGAAVLFLACFSILFGISAFASFFYTLRNLLSIVIIDETGMTFCQPGKAKVVLPWENIRFSGCCTKDSYRGLQKRYCFADRELTQEEQKDIALIHSPHISFSWLSQQELDYIQSRCPVPPDASIQQFLRCN